MSTQNVNVKPSTKESTTLRTDGFVRNIHSRNPFDVIRADVVLARMEKGKSGGYVLRAVSSHLLSMAMIYLGSAAAERSSGIHWRCGSTRLSADAGGRRTCS